MTMLYCFTLQNQLKAVHMELSQTWKILLILATGVVAGFVNTLAGGGSMLTVPMLIFLGLPPSTANGTNRIAIEVQNCAAILGFKRKGLANWRMSLQLAIPATLGALVGARIAVDIPEEAFQKVLAVVMVLVLGLILWQPTRRYQLRGMSASPGRRAVTIGALFLAGVYGGFIQAGVGFILIAALVTSTGLDLVTVNSHKVFIVAVYTLVAIVVFAVTGKVDWEIGLVLAIGTGFGGWIGSSFTVRTGEKWVRVALVIAVLAMAVRLSGIVSGWN